MPEAARTPSPAFERGTGPESLDYGTAEQVNALMGFVDEAEIDDDDDAFVPAGEEEEFIFGASERPAEPVTQGAPFGAGTDLSRLAIETEDQFASRVAEMIVGNQQAGKDARAWAIRRLAGQ